MPSKYAVVQVFSRVIAVVQAVRALNQWPVHSELRKYSLGSMDPLWLLRALLRGAFDPGEIKFIRRTVFGIVRKSVLFNSFSLVGVNKCFA